MTAPPSPPADPPRPGSRLPSAILAAGLLLAAASAARPEEPFRGAADLRAGEQVHAAFPAPAVGPHRWSVFLLEGESLAASVRADREADLRPGLRLAVPGGAPADPAPPVATTRISASMRGFRAPYAGWYVIEVLAERGSGGYRLRTRTTGGRRRVLPQPAAGGAGSFEFHAPAGSRASVRVAPRREGPSMEITGLRGPGGEAIPVLSIQEDPAARVQDVPLAEGGAHLLLWRNRGSAGDVTVTIRIDPPAPAAGVREFGVSEGLPADAIEAGDSSLPPRPGYAGSAACGRCHGEILRSWSGSVHNAAVRAWNRPGLGGKSLANDADGNGQDDFADGLDLAGVAAFASLGANAPRLSRVAGATPPNRVLIGGTSYAVDRTMGGNGLWRQRFLTRVGAATHVLPFEYDERTRTYAPYRLEDWYLPGGAPRPGGGAGLPADRSYEARCSGCHATGLVLAADPATGGVRAGSVESNVGCEQCHGPGAEHAVAGDVRRIHNPRSLLDGTAAGAAAANDACARCHSAGESRDPLPGLASPTEFGFRADRGVAAAGDLVADFLLVDAGGPGTWGPRTDALPGLPGTTSIAPRGDRRHGPDMAAGAHAPRDGSSAACFDCHDPHARGNPHQVRTRRPAGGGPVATRSEDNSLCLSCHAGDARFPGVTAADVAALGRGPAPVALARAVVDHMKDAGMPVALDRYDPAGSGVGRCDACHMPATATGGAPGTDPAGFARGDLRSHRFETVSAGASARHGLTNSCNACHPSLPGDPVADYLAAWAAPAAGESAYHGAPPPVVQDGIPLHGASNPLRAGGVACIRCHTAGGFARAEVNGESLSPSTVERIASRAVALEKGVTCDACHGRRADGQFHGSDRNPLRLPRTTLCDRCHNAASVVFADFRDRGVLLRHPQAEMVTGTAGEASPGRPATSTTSHSFLPDRCLSCHAVPASSGASHSFRASVAACASCHPGLGGFSRTAAGDYDGDGTTEGIQEEVQGLLDLLRDALLADPGITFAGGWFDRDGASDHALAGATEAQKRAAFNWYGVSGDGSRGVHNVARAVRLLQDSYRELTGVDVPGAVLR